jgi:hypothetical protein
MREAPMTDRGRKRRSPRESGERGSTLLLFALIVFVMLSGFTLLAASQLKHAERVNAEYGKLQALNAAEAGVYASLATTSGRPPTVLSADPVQVVFESRIMPPAPGGAPYRIESTGSVTLAGFTYRAHVSAFVSNGSIQEWTFD